MLSIIVSWIIIIFVACNIGKASVRLFMAGNVPQNLNTPDVSFVAGLLLVTVYAEFFSVFTNVGFLAFVLIFVLACILAVYNQKKGYTGRLSDIKNKLSKRRMVVLALALLAVLLWTSLVPQHYDTYLYHAQAIRWNEEYGVVWGLGNLHFRLAYNSAFISLQSLFSFKWLTGMSMHSVNGLITLAILGYIVLTSFKKRFQISDLMKLSIILYIGYDSFHASSPNTDTFALYLIFYVCVKWMEFAELKSRDCNEYGLLCVFLVFAATLKLSVASFVILAVYPCVLIIRQKKVRDLIKYIGTCIFIFIPYMIRSFIISGFFVYPVKVSGFLNVDWKMPENILDSDAAEIIAWGRGNKDISRNSEHIWQWFTEWFQSINILWKIIFVLMVVSVIYLFIHFVKSDKKKNIAGKYLVAAVLLGIVFWMETAPLPRYGAVYMLILISIALGTALVEIGFNISERVAVGTICAGVVLYLCMFFGYSYIYKSGLPTLFLQSDYQNRETKTVSVNNIDFAVPVEGDQTGYDPFPSTIGINGEKGTILRGDSLKDGFRVMEEGDR